MPTKVLVVEDDEGTATAVIALLNLKGFETAINSTGLDVFGNVRIFNPDLILMDIRLPNSSGIEICRDLKEFFQIPVLLLTTHLDKEQAMNDSKADGFIAKPFDIKIFMDLVTLFTSQNEIESSE